MSETHKFVVIGTKEYLQRIAELFKQKDAAQSANDIQKIFKELQRTIEFLENLPEVDPLEFVWKAHQIDTLYSKGGRIRKSSMRDENEQTRLRDTLKASHTAVQKYEQILKSPQNKVKIGDAAHQPLSYDDQMAIAGVWLYGFSALAQLVVVKCGTVKPYLDKAEKSLRRIHPDAMTQLVAAEANNCLLESAFLNNCIAKYHRDLHNGHHLSKKEHCECINTAIMYFNVSYNMFERLHAILGGALYLPELVRTSVNMARAMLGRLDEREWWDYMPQDEYLETCKGLLDKAEKMNTLRHDQERIGLPVIKDRLDYRLKYYEAHYNLKLALKFMPKKNLHRSDRTLSRETDVAAKWRIHLKDSYVGFQKCTIQFSAFHDTRKDIQGLLNFIEEKGGNSFQAVQGVIDDQEASYQSSIIGGTETEGDSLQTGLDLESYYGGTMSSDVQ